MSVCKTDHRQKIFIQGPKWNFYNEKEYIKGLGVYISSDLTWTRQINEVVSGARSMSGWALRTFSTREEEHMITIWNSLVRPCLDYCSSLWSPMPSKFQENRSPGGKRRSFTRKNRGL